MTQVQKAPQRELQTLSEGERVRLRNAALQKLQMENDFSKLSELERMEYAWMVCEHAGLDPVGQPLIYLNLKGKLSLYPTKGATEQLTRIHGINLTPSEPKEFMGQLMVSCVAKRTLANGYEQEVTERGFVPMPLDKNGKPAKGEDLANALAKVSTKARRRAVLAIVGFGFTESDDDVDLNVIDSQATVIAPDLPEIDAPQELEQPEGEDDAELAEAYAELFRLAEERGVEDADKTLKKAEQSLGKKRNDFTLQDVLSLITKLQPVAEEDESDETEGGE